MDDLSNKYTVKRLLFYPGMLILILLAAGCDRDCKDDVVETYYMPDSQKAMVPYETGDTLVFLYEQNAQKDTITFTGKKERKFEENSELINDCPRYRIEKYEQLHYNFYSKDKAHHLKVVNDVYQSQVIIKIGKIEAFFRINHLNKPYNGSFKRDTVYYKRGDVVISNKKYLDAFIRYDGFMDRFFAYKKEYGLIKLEKGIVNKSWLLLKYKML